MGRVRAPTPNGIGARVLTHACGERARGWQAHAASSRGRLLVARGTWRSNRGVYELAPREVQAPPYHDGRPGLRSFVKRGVTGHPDGSYIFAPASEHDGAADRALALSPGQRGRNGRSNSAPSQRLLPQRARPTACRRRGSRSREPPRCGAPALRLHRGAADRMVCERAHGAPELRGSSRVASWGHPSRWSAPRAAWGRSPGLNRACTADECKAAPVGEFFLEKIPSIRQNSCTKDPPAFTRTSCARRKHAWEW